MRENNDFEWGGQMSFEEFKIVYSKSMYRKGQSKISRKIRFIRDFMLCDKEEATKYLLLLEE